MARSADIDINAGARLDRLPTCGFHWRILALIGAGMFLDAFDIYLAGGVLGRSAPGCPASSATASAAASPTR
jgi:MFS transporter, putative metabolite:H+ symporter